MLKYPDGIHTLYSLTTLIFWIFPRKKEVIHVCIDTVDTCLNMEKRQNNNSLTSIDKMNETFVKQFSKTGESDFYIIDINIYTDIPFMPVSEINKLRRNAFDELMQKRILSYKRETQKTLKYAKFYKKELDYRANISNKFAEEFYRKCKAEPKEYALETKQPERQIELMRTKHCIKYALNMCKSSQKLFLEDEKGVKYPLVFDCKNCEMAVMSP